MCGSEKNIYIYIYSTFFRVCAYIEGSIFCNVMGLVISCVLYLCLLLIVVT